MSDTNETIPIPSTLTARDLVNLFYQPLGYLDCNVSSNKMWDYAKQRAIEVADMMLQEHPMYTGELNGKWMKWRTLKDELLRLS
jgi:hypothetical protein